MVKVFATIGVSLIMGFALASWMQRMPDGGSADSGGMNAGDYFDQAAATEQRIRALETSIAEERNARQLLEDELLVLFAEIDRLGAQDSGAERRNTVEARNDRLPPDDFRQRRAERSGEARISALVEAGFSADRADWILRREAELEVEAMQARFDARRSDSPIDRLDPSMNPNSMLRAELGDADYERYLQANGRPTAVAVTRVLESSPGQAAGLQTGDQIVRYGGSRVFDIADLSAQTLQGSPGESVVVDIIRDDVPMQIVMPRGPIGMQSGRFPRRQ
jgi:hypothetical protein